VPPNGEAAEMGLVAKAAFMVSHSTEQQGMVEGRKVDNTAKTIARTESWEVPQSLRVVAPHIIEAMVGCAEDRDIGLLAHLLDKFAAQIVHESDPTTKALYLSLEDFCRKAQEVERRYGEGVLLDLDHPSIQKSIQIGSIAPARLARIRALQACVPEGERSLNYLRPADHIRGPVSEDASVSG